MDCERWHQALRPRIAVVCACSHRFHINCMHDWVELTNFGEADFMCPGRDCFPYFLVTEVGECDEDGNKFTLTRPYDAFKFIILFKNERFNR